jgi:hypothetical protein
LKLSPSILPPCPVQSTCFWGERQFRATCKWKHCQVWFRHRPPVSSHFNLFESPVSPVGSVCFLSTWRAGGCWIKRRRVAGGAKDLAPPREAHHPQRCQGPADKNAGWRA